MSDRTKEGLNPHQAKVERIKQKVAAGLLDPQTDLETLEEIRQANLGQTRSTQPSDENPWEELPRSADHDPNSPAKHLTRKPFRKPTNKVVPTQSTLDGSA